MTFSLLPSSLSAVSSRRALAAVLLLSAALTGCSSLTSGEGGKRESLEQKAIREGAREDVEADRREQLAEMLRQDPGASLSDLPHARLAAQTNHACLAAIETMAERYSGRRVMLGEAAFVDSSDLVLDQTFLRGPDGQILDGRRGKPQPFIMQLPNGYETVVGEGGASLSGGEKQRISIARAILKDAPIIIFDEATANVDPENEDRLQQAIEALTRDKTVIMIAHRLNTVRNAAQILVVADGRIVQHGTHEELIAEGGIYADFITMRKIAVGWNVKNTA